MTQVEDDVARIEAVTARLAGPRTVWVLIVDNDSGITCSVYATEALAREAWESALRANWSEHNLLADALRMIHSGRPGCECPYETWWTLRECEVATQ